MKGALIDIESSPEKLVESFRNLHKDLDKFIGTREDGVPIGNVQLIKYIVSCYDKNSTIPLKYGDNWGERKKEAAIAANLRTKEGWVDGVSELLFGRNEIVNAVVIRYLSLLFHKDFMMYAAMSEMLISATSELMDFKFDRPSDATKAKSNVDELTKHIDELEEKIFSGGDAPELIKALNAHIEKFTVQDLRPENVVSRIEEGKPLVDEAPFGNYMPEKQKFVGDE